MFTYYSILFVYFLSSFIHSLLLFFIIFFHLSFDLSRLKETFTNKNVLKLSESYSGIFPLDFLNKFFDF